MSATSVLAPPPDSEARRHQSAWDRLRAWVAQDTHQYVKLN
ncbi:hypothetical protein [Streptomyces sp. NPDC004658]